MRVLHVSPYYSPSIGGLERFCEEIASRTCQLSGYEVHILTQTVAGKNEYEETNGLKIHRIKPLFKSFKALVTPNIQLKINDISPDIIHIQGPAPGMVDFISKNKRTRIIMTCHNGLDLNFNAMYKYLASAYRIFFFPRVVSKLDRFILLSAALRDSSKLFANVPPEKITIIPNGVDIGKFSPGDKNKNEYKRHLNINTTFLGIFVASMEPAHFYKGVAYLLQAISLLKGNLDINFCLIGEGELKQKYIEIAQSLGISNKVRFPGKVDDCDLVNYYRAADFFILPSTSVEFMPLVMIEAMACGTPVITTRLPGPMDIITEGYNGCIVKPRDSQALAKTIEEIISDENKLKQMQINARREALEKYAWDKILELYVREYHRN